MCCGGWRRCGAPGLARTIATALCCPPPPKTLRASAAPSCMAAGGTNARPGRRSGARGLFEGPHLRNRLRLAWMAGEGGRVRRTAGPAGGPGPAQDPRSSANAASPTLRWLRPKGQGERGPARDGGSPRMDYARGLRLALASMAVRCAAPLAKTLHARFASSHSMATERTNARPAAQIRGTRPFSRPSFSQSRAVCVCCRRRRGCARRTGQAGPRGIAAQICCPPTRVRGRAGSGRPSRPGFVGVQPGVRV